LEKVDELVSGAEYYTVTLVDLTIEGDFHYLNTAMSRACRVFVNGVLYDYQASMEIDSDSRVSIEVYDNYANTSPKKITLNGVKVSTVRYEFVPSNYESVTISSEVYKEYTTDDATFETKLWYYAICRVTTVDKD